MPKVLKRWRWTENEYKCFPFFVDAEAARKVFHWLNCIELRTRNEIPILEIDSLFYGLSFSAVFEYLTECGYNSVMNKFSNYVHSAVKYVQVANERTAVVQRLWPFFRIRVYDFKFSSDPFRPISTLVKSKWNSMNAPALVPASRKRKIKKLQKNGWPEHSEFHCNKICPAREWHATMGVQCSLFNTHKRARALGSLWMQMRIKKAATRKLDARNATPWRVMSENEIKYC